MDGGTHFHGTVLRQYVMRKIYVGTLRLRKTRKNSAGTRSVSVHIK